MTAPLAGGAASEPSTVDAGEVDVNQVIAHKVGEARRLRGWTQLELAAQLEPYLGRRLSQAGVSSMERAAAGGRRRQFDGHELLVFSLVFDLPILWFLLPPPGDRRLVRGSDRRLDQLPEMVLGRSQPGDALVARLRRTTVDDEVFEQLTGGSRQRYRDGRRESAAAVIDDLGDAFDAAINQLGAVLDQWRERRGEPLTSREI